MRGAAKAIVNSTQGVFCCADIHGVEDYERGGDRRFGVRGVEKAII